MVVTFKITAIRDVMPQYFTQIYQHFVQTCHMNILPQKTEGVGFCATLVHFYKTTGHHIP
jgi:hypothetical protein